LCGDGTELGTLCEAASGGGNVEHLEAARSRGEYGTGFTFDFGGTLAWLSS
jgi:hypothetical protein